MAAVEARRRRPVALVPLGVDVTVFHPRQTGDGPEPATDAPPTILWVGGLEPVKDPSAMLRAFARLAPEHPDLRLEMVGDGALRPGLERDVERLGLDGRVRFAGQLARSTMPDRYRSAALLAVTSRHEGQSMVAVEAAACGLPVVGTRVGVLPDLADAALTVPVGDEPGLAAAMAAVLDDPDRMAAMGTAARHIAETRFDLDSTSDALLERYEAVVRRGAGPPFGR
jgi:glycosyltransferase involved in cell wall biosynthesis